MSSFSERILNHFRSLLPSPFAIALILTLITFIAAWFLTGDNQGPNYLITLATYWEQGLWNSPLLTFAFQMMLMLVLGHAIALSDIASRLIRKIVVHCDSTARAAFIITLSTMLVSYVNWGLGLVFGAILARETARAAQRMSRQINYPLIGAAGYSGMMVWHGGFSGSAPLKIAEPGHFLEPVIGVVPVSQTLFSEMNLWTVFLSLLIFPALMYWLGKRMDNHAVPIPLLESMEERSEQSSIAGMEKIDHSGAVVKIIGAVILVWLAIRILGSSKLTLGFITPDFINLMLLGTALACHRSIQKFFSAVEEGMRGAAGILIQFPLYFGIMGIMSSSGMIALISDWFVSVSNSETFAFFTLISASLVNVFVPSGGGQWAVQGPIVAEAAAKIGAPISEAVMALAYGDQLTNMLQPFWALPLLGITRLNARDILPYSIMLMMAGLILFALMLFLF